MAIGRRALEHVHADRAGGARLIFDDHGLMKAVAQLLPDQARGDVAGATGRIRDDDLNGLGRKVLRRSYERHQGDAANEKWESEPEGAHGFLTLGCYDAAVTVLVR